MGLIYKLMKRLNKIEKNKLMELQQGISYKLNQQKIGKIYLALVEEIHEKGVYIGRTYMDSPEIDGVVYIYSDKKNKYRPIYPCKNYRLSRI